jgi:hypothetical protein
MTTMKQTHSALVVKALFAANFILLVGACGQAPSFKESKEESSKSSDQEVAIGTEGMSGHVSGQVDENGMPIDPSTTTDETVNGTETDDNVLLPGGNEWTPDWADQNNPGNPEPLPGEVTNGGATTGTSPEGTATPPTVIPGADDDDLDALHKCLSKWRNNPFNGKTVNNFHRISASVTVGGYGNAVNDTENTEEPYLILIDAGVNVGGAPTYQLMNKNGYYCMNVNVNVQTNFTINLHCNARLADTKVNVNVGSTQNDSTSAVGVHVLSNVQINSVRPEGEQCIR